MNSLLAEHPSTFKLDYCFQESMGGKLVACGGKDRPFLCVSVYLSSLANLSTAAVI